VPFIASMLDDLRDGRLSLTFGIVEQPLPPGLRREALYGDSFVTVLRADHPALAGLGARPLPRAGACAGDGARRRARCDGRIAEGARTGPACRAAAASLYAAMAVVAESDLVGHAAALDRGFAMRGARARGRWRRRWRLRHSRPPSSGRRCWTRSGHAWLRDVVRAKPDGAPAWSRGRRRKSTSGVTAGGGALPSRACGGGRCRRATPVWSFPCSARPGRRLGRRRRNRSDDPHRRRRRPASMLSTAVVRFHPVRARPSDASRCLEDRSHLRVTPSPRPDSRVATRSSCCDNARPASLPRRRPRRGWCFRRLRLPRWMSRFAAGSRCAGVLGGHGRHRGGRVRTPCQACACSPPACRWAALYEGHCNACLVQRFGTPPGRHAARDARAGASLRRLDTELGGARCVDRPGASASRRKVLCSGAGHATRGPGDGAPRRGRPLADAVAVPSLRGSVADLSCVTAQGLLATAACAAAGRTARVLVSATGPARIPRQGLAAGTGGLAKAGGDGARDRAARLDPGRRPRLPRFRVHAVPKEVQASRMHGPKGPRVCQAQVP
jgi:hypothetical protein